MTIKIKMPVASFRRIINPFEQEGKKMYLAVVQAKEVSEDFMEWRKINPRDPKTKSAVSKRIFETLKNEPEAFLFRNRGITILAEQVSFDNTKGEMSIEFSDVNKHGILDGGHTYAVIRDAFNSLEESEKTDTNMNNAYVKFEILEGISEKNDVVEIIDARNTSLQVKDQSLDNLRSYFDNIKEILKDKSYADRIAYKESEFTDEGAKKDIDIKEILSYLICFDCEKFDDDNHPIIAYNSKGTVLSFANSDDNRNRLEKYLPLLPQILELRDLIYKELPLTYNNTGGRFGSILGIDKKNSASIELPFLNEKSDYAIPNSFIYPILASLRNLVLINNNKCSWKKDPTIFFNDYKVELVKRLCDQALDLRSPNRLGRDKATWRSCYDYVAMQVMKLHI